MCRDSFVPLFDTAHTAEGPVVVADTQAKNKYNIQRGVVNGVSNNSVNSKPVEVGVLLAIESQ